jgi:hypothetical protein
VLCRLVIMSFLFRMNPLSSWKEHTSRCCITFWVSNRTMFRTSRMVIRNTSLIMGPIEEIESDQEIILHQRHQNRKWATRENSWGPNNVYSYYFPVCTVVDLIHIRHDRTIAFTSPLSTESSPTGTTIWRTRSGTTPSTMSFLLGVSPPRPSALSFLPTPPRHNSEGVSTANV